MNHAKKPPLKLLVELILQLFVSSDKKTREQHPKALVELIGEVLIKVGTYANLEQHTERMSRRQVFRSLTFLAEVYSDHLLALMDQMQPEKIQQVIRGQGRREANRAEDGAFK